MLDIKFIRDNLDAVKANISARNMTADPDRVVRLYEERNSRIQNLDELRQARNENAKKMKGPMDNEARQVLIAEGKRIKEQITEGESLLVDLEERLNDEARKIPNMAHPDAPIGKEDKDNLEISRSGEVPSFDFTPRDHVELGQLLDIIDFETGTKVSGTKFYYLKNEGVFLELGLIRYALDILRKHGFTPTITPDIAKEEVVSGIGFNPRGEESNIYTLEGTGTCLVGTAEITLGGYHAGEMLNAEDLPIMLAGVSHCFRREAGAAGQFSKGLYRVHQFTKIEMFVYCRPEDSADIHEKLREIEEEIFQGLEVPYRVVDTCTGDLGAPAYRKYDLEAWMPGRGDQGGWGEITSTSNCTDYQARRLNVRFKDDRQKAHVHMLNGTAVANSRAIISILENFQEADGSVRIPKKLVPYVGFERISPRK
jgi:seryl-tRNA synthetase